MRYKTSFFICLFLAHILFVTRCLFYIAFGNTIFTAVCMTVSLIFAITSSFLFFQSIQKILEAARTSHDLEMLRKQQELQQEQEANLKSIQERTLRFRERAIVQLKTLQNYIEDNDFDNASCYLKEISQNFESSRFHPLCQDSLISIILQSKKESAQSKNIRVEYKLFFPDKLELAHTDLSSLFFNLLDNGIEACEASGEEHPFLSLNVNFQANYLYLHMKNTKNRSAHFDHSTTKSDYSMHGFGLSIIEEIVAKYDGDLSWQDNGTVFESRIMLKYEEKSQPKENV